MTGSSLEGLPVALLTPRFWPEVTRGTERLVYELARGLRHNGLAPRIVTSHRGPPERGREGEIPVLRVWRPPDGFLVRRGFDEHMTHLPFAYAALRRGDDAIAHAFNHADANVAAWWSRRTGRPSVYTCNGIPDEFGLIERRLRRGLTRRAVEGCSAVVTVSRWSAQAFRRTLGIEARVIHPGVDMDAFRPAPERAEEPTVFCAASPEVTRKRVDLLVSAFRLVHRDRPSASLRLMRPSRRDLARELEQAAPGISLVDPTQSRAGLAAEYGRAWASALPSVSEAFGLVLVESMACGTPAVGTDREAFPEVIDRPEVGRLFEDGDGERSLARALLEALELAEDPGTPEACRSRAAEFSTDLATERHLALYGELLGPR